MSHSFSNQAGNNGSHDSSNSANNPVPTIEDDSYGQRFDHSNIQRALINFTLSASNIVEIRSHMSQDPVVGAQNRRELTEAVEDEKQIGRDSFNNQSRCDVCRGGPLDQDGRHTNFQPADIPGMAEVRAAYRRIEETFQSGDFLPHIVDQAAFDEVNEMFRLLTYQYLQVNVEHSCTPIIKQEDEQESGMNEEYER